MKVISAIAAIILTAPTITHAQDYPYPLTSANAPVRSPQPVHDPWAVAGHSPNLNLADSIGSTSKQAMTSKSCSNSNRGDCGENQMLTSKTATAVHHEQCRNGQASNQAGFGRKFSCRGTSRW